MSNNVLELASLNFETKGYNITRIQSENKCSMIIPYKIIDGVLNAIVLTMFEDGNEWDNESYNNVLRTFRNVMLDDDVNEINMHQVIFTRQPKLAYELGIDFMSYWIVDMNESLIMIYENQPAAFMDSKKIIEDSINGIDYNSFSGFNKKTFPVVTAVLFIVNIVSFILLEIFGSTYNTGYMLEKGALSYSQVIYVGEYYRLFTHFFMHFGLEHLANNMLVLLVLGYHLESVIKKGWFLVLYISSGLFAGIISMNYYHMMGEPTVSVGASGAIFGMLGALFALIIVNKGKIEGLSFGRVIMFLILTLYSGYREPDVDNAAHVAGFVFGTILMLIIYAGRCIGTRRRKGKSDT